MSAVEQDIAAITAVEAARQKALIAVDVAVLDKIFADDLIHIHSTGRIDTKAGFIAHLQKLGGFQAIERGPLNIRVEGDVALVTGTVIQQLTSPETGKIVTMDGIVSQALRRASTGWVFILSQLTLHKKP